MSSRRERTEDARIQDAHTDWERDPDRTTVDIRASHHVRCKPNADGINYV